MDPVPGDSGFHFTSARRYDPRARSVCRLGRFNATTLAAICVLPHESAMTSREATSLLPRSTADEANAISRSIADWRSEERRVGKECVSTCRSRWSALHYKKKQSTSMNTDYPTQRSHSYT